MRKTKRLYCPIAAALVAIALVLPAGARGGGEMPMIKLGSDTPGLDLELHLGTHFDFVGFDGGLDNIGGVGSQENDFIIRRARIIFKGKLWDDVGFYTQAGLALDGPTFLDAMVRWRMAPGLYFSAGQMKMPFSQERLDSYVVSPFMERSLASNLELRRSQGVTLSGEIGGGGLVTTIGLFTGENMNEHGTDDDFEYVGRLEFHLDKLLAAPGDAQLAFSAARGMRAPERGDTLSFRGRTMNGFTFFGRVPVNGYRTRYEGDAHYRLGPVWLGGECILVQEERDGVTVDIDTNGDGIADMTARDDLDDLLALGWMVKFMWVITGEPATGLVIPERESGALALVLRYSALGFESGEERIRTGVPGVSGFEVSDSSGAFGSRGIDASARELYAGFNWYIKPGFFVQAGALYYWFDEAEPYAKSDSNNALHYRARLAIAI